MALRRARTALSILIVSALASCGGGGGSSSGTLPSVSTTPAPRTAAAPSIAQWSDGASYAPPHITVSFPKAPAPGDVLVVAFWNNAQITGAANTYAAPVGWTVVDENAGSFATYEVFAHLVAPGEGNAYAFTPSSAERAHAWIAADATHTGGIDRTADRFVNDGAAYGTLDVLPSHTGELAIAFNLPASGSGVVWANPPAWKIGIDNASMWEGEALYLGSSTTEPISETSASSVPTSGFAGIILLAPAGAAVTEPPVTTTQSIDWPTFGFDLQRTGYNPNETAIGPNSFGTLHPTSFGLPSVGAFMQGEPVLAMSVNLNGANRNLLYAGAQSGVFYALDADTGAIAWSKQLGTGKGTCGASAPFSWGIEGTPALDRPHNRIYVSDGANQVHALDLGTGAEIAGWPVSIAPETGHDFMHAALTYNSENGLLYAETSSTCDLSPWHGRISAIDVSSASVIKTFYPEQGNSGGGIWGVGGASIDPSNGNVFLAVGNADSSAQNENYSEHIVELSADLGTVIAANYPPNMPVMFDSDFGATPMLFQPMGCPPLLAAMNKSGAFVLYDRANIAAGPIQEITMANTGSQFRGVPSYDPVTNDVYVGLPDNHGIYQSGVGAFSIAANCTLNPVPVWNAAFGSSSADVRSPITIANGVVYAGGAKEDAVYALDAATGAQLWNAGVSAAAAIGPIVASGRLYAADVGGTIHAWQP